MSVKRRERVADAIQEALAEILRRVKDPRVGMVGVTGVELSPDLRHAKVRISVIGDDAARRRAMEGLERARGFIRSELGRAIRLRHVPELDFRLDESAAYSVRIAQLLRQIRATESGAAPAGSPGEASGAGGEPGAAAPEGAGRGAAGADGDGDGQRGHADGR
ncbi:MAG TPA: 30S ribosome-binding factor RbfA [Thermaerobacter sp.]